MNTTKRELAVTKTVTVNAPQKHVFTVFTEGQSAWWPLKTHHIGAQTPQVAVIEPRVGGRWFERAADGSECNWGRVLLWEPFERVVLAWEIDAQFRQDPNLRTEVDVRFIAEGPGKTRVELEHRLLENFGDQADRMQAVFDSDGGWTGLLAGFATYLESGRRGEEVACPAGSPAPN
jgi:uncharacterized protein YndB with AHSA1/START domain